MMEVVDILKVGISGLVFLLALLGYRLLAQLARSGKQDTKVLHTVRWYMLQTTGLALVVAAISVVPLWLSNHELRESAIDCDLTLHRLKAQTQLSNATLAGLQAAIEQHSVACEPVLRKLSSNSGG
jgi:hypothetical protein